MVQLKESKDTRSILPTLVPVLMDFGTAPFQNTWAQRARDRWCLIIQDAFWKSITLMWLLRFQRTFLLWGISPSLALSAFYKWEDQGIEKLLDFAAMGTSAAELVLHIHASSFSQAPLLFKRTVSQLKYCTWMLLGVLSTSSWSKILMSFSDISHHRFLFHSNESSFWLDQKTSFVEPMLRFLLWSHNQWGLFVEIPV